MLLPVRRHLVVDLAGPLVEDRLRVAVVAHRRVDRLPDVPLPPRAALLTQHQLEAVHRLDRGADVPEVVAVAGARDPPPRPLGEEGVLVVVDVDDGVLAEVDRVGAGREAAVVEVGIQHLDAERLPAPGRAAVHEPRPALPEAAELLLDERNQLLVDRVAVGPEVRRVHGVRVVVVRVGVLDLDQQEAGEAGRRPVLVELVGLLLLGAVVALPVEPLRVHRLQIGVGRIFPEAVERVRKMSVVDDQRVAGPRVLVEPGGQQHVRAEEHRAPPELRQLLALDADVLDVLRLGGIRDRRDHLVEREAHRLARGDRDRARRAVEVPGRAVPLPALAPVHRQLDDLAVRAVKRFVHLEQRLHRVGAGGNVGEAANRVGDGRLVHGCRGTRSPALDVHPRDDLRVRAVVDLEARLGARIGGQHHEQAPVERPALRRPIVGHLEPEAGRARPPRLRRDADGDEHGRDERHVDDRSPDHGSL